MPSREDSGWNVVGRRGRVVARKDDERTGKDDEDDEEDEEPRPKRPPTSSSAKGPRPRARVVADVVSSVVGECSQQVSRSRALKSLLARLDECEEDFAEDFEERGESSAPWRCVDVRRMTVLGLGSLESSRTSRLQAALALALARERFPRVTFAAEGGEGGGGGDEGEGREGDGGGGGRKSSLFAADPAFTDADRDALSRLGFEVVPPDEAAELGRAPREGGAEGEMRHLAFFYLPHCYPPVAEEVLRAHWTPRDLSRVAILGNSLSSVAEKARRDGSVSATPRCAAVGSATTTSKSSSSPSPPPSRSLAMIEASVVGPELDAASARSGLGAAFNDTALHLFPRWPREFGDIE